MLILTEFCTLNILKAKNSGQSLSEQKPYRQRACKICIWASAKGILPQFSQLGGLAGSAGRSNVVFPKEREGSRLIPRLGLKTAFCKFTICMLV